MRVMVLLTAPVKPEEVSNLKSTLPRFFRKGEPTTGVRELSATLIRTDPNSMVFVEHWESREVHQKYLQWRTETGIMDALGLCHLALPESATLIKPTSN